MKGETLNNPRRGAKQGQGAGRALPDRWNPRVWIRDWLNARTPAEQSAHQREVEEMGALRQVILTSAEGPNGSTQAAARQAMLEQGEAAFIAVVGSLDFPLQPSDARQGSVPISGDSNGPMDEPQLAAQLRERLSRMQMHSGASRPWPPVDPGANATPDPTAPELEPQDSQTTGEQG